VEVAPGIIRGRLPKKQKTEVEPQPTTTEEPVLLEMTPEEMAQAERDLALMMAGKNEPEPELHWQEEWERIQKDLAARAI
jgi:hypothetical protein